MDTFKRRKRPKKLNNRETANKNWTGQSRNLLLLLFPKCREFNQLFNRISYYSITVSLHCHYCLCYRLRSVALEKHASFLVRSVECWPPPPPSPAPGITSPKNKEKNQNKSSKFRVKFSSFFRPFPNSENLDLHGQNRSNNARKTRGKGRRSRKLRNKHSCNGKEETEPFFRHRLTLVRLPPNLTTVHHCVPVHRMSSPFTSMMIHPSSPLFNWRNFVRKLIIS